MRSASAQACAGPSWARSSFIASPAAKPGMRHFMAQFGPALKLPWTKLMDVPELTRGFIDKIAEQSDRQAAGASLHELERKRDDCLIAIMQALRTPGFRLGKDARRPGRAAARQGASWPGARDASRHLPAVAAS